MAQINKGTTDVTRYIMIVDSTTGQPETGVTITDLDLSYIRTGSDHVAKVDATALGSVDAAHDDNKMIEVDATLFPGLYRVDWPDAAFVDGVDTVILSVTGTGFHPAIEEIELVDALAVTSGAAATSVTAVAAPGGFVITTGTSEANDEDSTHQLDGTTHDLEDVGNTTDAYYIFNVGGNGVPVSVTWWGYANNNNKSYAMRAYNWGTASWEQVGTVSGKPGSGVESQTFQLTDAHVGTGANLGLVHFGFYSTDGTKFATDRILCAFSTITKSVGYANGQIHVDTNASNTNTESYVDGVADNPVSTWAAALTLSGQLNITSFHIANGSTITLSGNSDNYTLTGDAWSLALGGQSIEGAHFSGATDVTGTGVATTTQPTFDDCNIGAATLPPAIFHRCGIGKASGQFTAGSDGEFVFDKCISLVPGSGTPVFVFSGLGATTGINNRGWNGGANYTLDSDCTLSHEVHAGGGVTVTTGGADVEIRGICRSVTLVLSGAGTVQIACLTGPIAISGTTTATVNLYGVATSLTDTSVTATVTDGTVQSGDIESILGAVAGKIGRSADGETITIYDRAGSLLSTLVWNSGTNTWDVTWA